MKANLVFVHNNRYMLLRECLSLEGDTPNISVSVCQSGHPGGRSWRTRPSCRSLWGVHHCPWGWTPVAECSTGITKLVSMLTMTYTYSCCPKSECSLLINPVRKGGRSWRHPRSKIRIKTIDLHQDWIAPKIVLYRYCATLFVYN